MAVAGASVPNRLISKTAAGSARFEILDGVRAVALLSVFGYHFGLPVDPVMRFGGIGYRIIPNLDLGVEIFFVLSGFLIFRPFAEANLLGTPFPKVGAYAIRRVSRIYPAYWVALTAFLILGEVKINGGFLRYLAHYGLVQTYLPGDLRYAFDGIGPAWSLVVEVSFYVLVPILAVLLRHASFGAHLGALASITAFGYVMRAFTIWHPLDDKLGGWLKSGVGVLPLALAALGPGMVLAVLSVARSQRAYKLFQPVWLWWLVAVAGLGVLTVAAPTSVAAQFRSSTGSAEFWHRMVTPIIAVAFVGPCVLGDGARSSLFRILRARWLVGIGVVSYGAYLWHHPLLLDSPGDLVHLSFRGLVGRSMWVVAILAVGFLALTIVFATMSWFGVERPAQRCARRIVVRRSTDRAG